MDVEEGAIAEALKKLAHTEIQALLPVRARLEAHHLSGLDMLDE